MATFEQSETPVLPAEAVSGFARDSIDAEKPPATGCGGTENVQRVDPEALLVLAEWHERRAFEQDRFASNAETDLWRTGCERRASFHRMIGDYLRALHVDLLKLRDGHTDDER